MEWRSYFWKMAAVCVLVSAVLLTGCGGTGSPAADDPGFDERLFGTWERETDTHRFLWEFRSDWTSVDKAYDLADGTFLGSESSTFTVNADIFVSVAGWGRSYVHFSLPDANTLVMVHIRAVVYDNAGNSTIHEIPDAVAMTWHRVTQ